MQALFNGIYWGLFLAILVGPVLFILVQASIERGFRAGAMIACGMWASDLVFVLLTYFGLALLVQVTEWSGFESVLGTAGGLILVVLGISNLRRAPPLPVSAPAVPGDYAALWGKGFVVNTINPFCVLFWVMIGSAVVTDSYQGSGTAVWFYAGVLSTIVLTDCLKVYLAKGLRKRLTARHLAQIRQGTGSILILVGIGFVMRPLI